MKDLKLADQKPLIRATTSSPIGMTMAETQERASEIFLISNSPFVSEDTYIHAIKWPAYIKNQFKRCDIKTIGQLIKRSEDAIKHSPYGEWPYYDRWITYIKRELHKHSLDFSMDEVAITERFTKKY